MHLISLYLFLLLALIHLCACALGREKLRVDTKPLLMPLLLGFYLLTAPGPHVLAVLALLCGFVGDVALVAPKRAAGSGRADPWLLIGLGAFLAGHICYSILFAQELHAPRWAWIAVPCAGLLLFLVIFLSLRPHMGALMLPGGAYLLALMTMACLACLSAFSAPCRAPGALLFLLSDYILARSILLGKRRFTDFWVMLTYLAAQTLLVLSLF